MITIFPVLRGGRGSRSGFTRQVLQGRRGAEGFAHHASEGQRRTTARVAQCLVDVCLLPPRRRSLLASAPLAPPPPLTPAVFMTHSPGTLGDVSNQIRNGFMQVGDTPLPWFAGGLHVHTCSRSLGWDGMARTVAGACLFCSTLAPYTPCAGHGGRAWRARRRRQPHRRRRPQHHASLRRQLCRMYSPQCSVRGWTNSASLL